MRRRKRWLAGLAGVGLAAAIGVGVISQAPPGYALPNGSTPGAILTSDPGVICVPGYTATIRVGLTPAEARQADRAYGWIYAPGKQEYDHLVPLELGGANGLANIWPEPIAQAHVKDRLENALHAQACTQHTAAAVQAAQTCIRVDWVACWQREGRP